MVSTVFAEGDAWSGVLERISCARCGFIIPAHLAQRWDDISVEQARREWSEIYRAISLEENE